MASEHSGPLFENYDSLVRRIVPRYDEMTMRVVEHLPATATRILELGCGTGNLSIALAARFSDAELTFVDAAPSMLAAARSRLESAHPHVMKRARFVEARFEDMKLAAGSFDVITSQMSLHHVEKKGALFQQLFTLLTEGGAVCFADRMIGGTEENQAASWQRWVDHCRRNCTEAEVEGLIRHAEAHDHYASLADHFHLLESAGFRGLDCVWRDWAWAIVSATRMASRSGK